MLGTKVELGKDVSTNYYQDVEEPCTLPDILIPFCFHKKSCLFLGKEVPFTIFCVELTS